MRKEGSFFSAPWQPMALLVELWALLIAALLCGCHGSRSVTRSSSSCRDSVAVSTDTTSTATSMSASHSLNMLLDSLDVWIYDYPPGAGSVTGPDSASVSERRVTKCSVGAPRLGTVHVTARRASIGSSGMSELKTESTALTVKSVVSRADERTSDESQSVGTAVAKPPNLWLVAGLSIAVLLCLAAIYKAKK